LPSSPAAGHTPLGPEDIDSTEVKFQFSVKSQILGRDDIKFLRFMGFDTYRLWFAYTQQSVWQAYNQRNSAPFRDSVYEPELILTLGRSTDAPFKAFKLVNIGFNHQSNGRSDPYSRSWWRVYGQAGFEFGDFTVLGRAWWRIHESRLADDNPDIDDYTGRGDIAIRWERAGYAVGLLLRNNLSFGPNRGFAQADVSVPWLSEWLGLQNVQLHFQVATGYGESLIDYNHRQTSFGIGVALGDTKNQRP
jgi:phospholipase A1